MINVLLARILVLFLVIYIVHLVYKKYIGASLKKNRNRDLRKREYTDYDQDEWEKIKKSLED
ncbi:hypothetical protein ACFL3D_01625 [Candidatus Omnitrophota bacterium]